MELAIDCVLKKESSKEIFRVSCINYKDNQVFLFRCQDNPKKLKFPEFVQLDSLEKDFDKGKYTVVEDDPYSKGKSESLKHDQSPYFRKASIFFQHVMNEVAEGGHELLMYKNTRWKIIRRACKKANAKDQSGLNWIKLLFNHGFSLNSLRPKYEKCGAPKKARKRGIPKKFRTILLSNYLKLHLLLGMFLKDAWKNTKEEIEKGELGATTKYKINRRAFRFYGEQEYSKEDRDRIRNGETDYNNNKRMLRGRAIDGVDGPCYRYQIDSSVRDIQCVLSYDRNQFIGKATFYIVSDVWSGAIIGIYITLDPPSYVAAAYALYIALTDKRELYKSLGLDLKHLTFNHRGIPFEIVADRAELLGPKSNNIIKICGIRAIGNTVAYSPIQKGNVEKLIDLVQDRVYSQFLGHGQVLRNDGERGAKDTQAEATVTLEELYRISLIIVNEYNTVRPNSNYRLTEKMLIDKVDKIPSKIYQWGIANNLGKERIKSAKELRFVFFEPVQEKDISVSKKGIKVGGQEFVPVDADKSKEIRRLASAGKLDVVFNPVKYEEWFCMNNNQMIPLRRRGKKDIVFKNQWEARAVLTCDNKRMNELKQTQEAVEIENDKEIAAMIKHAAEKQTKVRKTGARKAKSFQREIDKQKRYGGARASTPRAPKTKAPKLTTKRKSKWLSNVKKINQ